PFIVALDRDFVSCFSRFIQHLEDNHPAIALVEEAKAIAPATRVSGWGFYYRSSTAKLLGKLKPEMVGLSGVLLKSECPFLAPYFFPLRNRLKIDPSIVMPQNKGMQGAPAADPEAKVVVTRFSDLACPRGGGFSEIYFGDGLAAPAWLPGTKICELSANPCVQSIERFP